MKRAVNYEVARRRADGTHIKVVQPEIIDYNKGDRVEFDLDIETMKGVPSKGWTIESVTWKQIAGASGKTTSIVCVPTQQYAVSRKSGAYDEVVGDKELLDE